MTILTWPLGQSFFVDNDDFVHWVRISNSPAVSVTEVWLKLGFIFPLLEITRW